MQTAFLDAYGMELPRSTSEQRYLGRQIQKHEDVYKRQDQSIINVEGDKASMEVPAPEAGVVKEVLVKAVSYTHLMLVLI